MVAGLLIAGIAGAYPSGLNFAVTGSELSPPLDQGSLPVDSIPSYIGLGIALLYFGVVFAFMYGAADGLIVGLLQWFVIRPYVRESYWWALINVLAIAAAGAVVLVG